MRANKRKPSVTTVTWDTVCEFARRLHDAEESTSYGTPAFKVRGKLFVRFHQNGHSIIVRVDEHERKLRMKADPGTFYMTDHYIGSPWMLVRLSAVSRNDLHDLLKESWRRTTQGLE